MVNTAQTVRKHLDHLRNASAQLASRWIWELLQNAIDAASGRQARISIRATETELRYEHDGEAQARFVAIATGRGNCSAAIQLLGDEDNGRVDPAQKDAARLFIGFPLVGSERMGLLASVDSGAFAPTEGRDGIHLNKGTDHGERNRRLLQDSLELQAQLLEWCADREWKGTARLLASKTRAPDEDNDNASWLHERVSEAVERIKRPT